MPDADVVESVFDKQRFSVIAAELGVPVPENIAELDHFPVVIKPRFNCFWHDNQGVSVSTTIAHNAEEARTAMASFEQKTGEKPLLQRWVAGEEYGVTVLCQAGEILTMSAHKRLRSLSSTGGASTAKKTIAIPEAFKGQVERIVRTLSWTGPAMFEFRGNPDSAWVLLEMNGRFWGSLPLAVMAGTDFPLLAFQMATHHELTGNRTARVGVYSRHFTGDVARIARMSGPARLAAIGALLRGFFPPFHDDLCSWSDPSPWFWDIWDSMIR
jgi:carbamoylphosphate synthase large subunit